MVISDVDIHTNQRAIASIVAPVTILIDEELNSNDAWLWLWRWRYGRWCWINWNRSWCWRHR
ncbi:MAG: hypothetical protein AAF492_28235, partial [Verrucomicrobiota bacterium]